MSEDDLLPSILGGSGKRPGRFVGPPKTTALSSPWDLLIHGSDLYIAMAGNHQIWKMSLDGKEIGPHAGNGREDIVDGAMLPPQPYAPGFASFAQPSGLASDGQTLFVADSEGALVRSVPFGRGEVKTIVGTSGLKGARLFTFGDADGPRNKVLLQHPLGLAWHDGIYIADTYNNKIKRIDAVRGSAAAVAGSGKAGAADGAVREAQFSEPSGLAYADGKLYVADTNNHLIRTIDLVHDNRVATLEIRGLKPPTLPEVKKVAKPSFADAEQIKLPAARLKPADGAVHIAVRLALPQGFKMNPLAPERYYLEAADEKGPVDREALGKLQNVEPPAERLDVRVPVKELTGHDTLCLSMNYYYCQEKAEGVCKVGSVTWTIPLELAADATTSAVSATLNVEK